jgi:hypothetical protein
VKLDRQLQLCLIFVVEGDAVSAVKEVMGIYADSL